MFIRSFCKPSYFRAKMKHYKKPHEIPGIALAIFTKVSILFTKCLYPFSDYLVAVRVLNPLVNIMKGLIVIIRYQEFFNSVPMQ